MKLLKEISINKEDVDTSSRASYLLGEYNLKQGDYKAAAEYYIKAAFEGSNDKDFIAQSVLKAAESAALSGNKKESIKMLEVIFKNYKNTVWDEKASELLKVYK